MNKEQALEKIADAIRPGFSGSKMADEAGYDAMKEIQAILNALSENETLAHKLAELATYPSPCYASGIVTHTMRGRLPVECKQDLSAFDYEWLKRNGWKLTKMDNGKYKVEGGE